MTPYGKDSSGLRLGDTPIHQNFYVTSLNQSIISHDIMLSLTASLCGGYRIRTDGLLNVLDKDYESFKVLILSSLLYYVI